MKKLLLTFGIFISLSLVPSIVFANSSNATTESNFDSTTESQEQNTEGNECEHIWGEWEVIVDALCDSNGSELRYCTKCGQSEERSIPATNQHRWSDWETDVPKNCLFDNVQRRYCNTCLKEETRIVPAYGKHNWSKWLLSALPTCKISGKKFRVCQRCGEEQTITINKNSSYHNYTNWVVSKAPTVIRAGQKTRTCFYCGNIEHLSIKKLPAKLILKKNRLTIRKKQKVTFPSVSYSAGDKIKAYQSKNKKIASVNKKGVIIAKQRGTVKIFIIMKSGIKKYCIVKVK